MSIRNETLEAVDFEQSENEAILQLAEWGSPVARLSEPDGTIGERALDWIREQVKDQPWFNEFCEQVQGKTFYIHSMPNGLGHRRVAEELAMMARLGGATVHILDYGLDSPKETPEVDKFGRANGFDYQTYWLIAKGRKDLADELTPPKGNIWWVLNQIHRKLGPKAHEAFLSGDTEKSKPADILQQLQVLEMVFGREFKGYIRSLPKDAVHICVHPMLTPLFPPETPVVVPGTDGFLARNWVYADAKHKRVHYMVETHLAKEELVTCWSRAGCEDMDDRITATGGFPAPLAALVAARLNWERAFSDKPPLMIMLASGVAPLQVKTFIATLRESAADIASGKLRVFIQAGYGQLGEITKREILEEMTKLEAEMGIRFKKSQVVIHQAKTATEAVHAYDMACWYPGRKFEHFKGGEGSRMVNELKSPLVPTGVAGIHEIHNLYFLIKDGSPIFFTRDIYETFKEQLLPMMGSRSYADFEALYMNPIVFDSFAGAMAAALDYYDSMPDAAVAENEMPASAKILLKAVSLV